MKIEDIARVCHQANRAYSATRGEIHPEWEQAPDWQRESAIVGVTHALNNPSVTPEEMHNQWLQHKVDAGWQYGPVKDPDKKLHPCMRPYAELSDYQRAKDAIFASIVQALRHHLIEWP